jgi:cysteine desulfurase
MLMALDMRGIATSAGSACQSGSVSASHVLSAMGVTREIANAALRLSLGSLTDASSIDRVVNVMGTLAAKARGAVPAVS